MERSLKALVWLYVVLLLVEGALRKWALPSLADPLLIVRDPVVLAIYCLAFASGRFPLNGFVLAILALAGASVLFSFAAGQDNLLVTLYGLRIDYVHLPLIWVMGRVMTRRDVKRLGTFLLLAALPMTAVMVLQFKSPIFSWINRGIGGDEGGQIYGADGRIRPPGLFSFITGPQLYYPLVAAFFLNQLGERRRLWWPLLAACGLAILIALPVSISRTVMLATGLVGLMFVCCLPFAGAGGGSLLRTLLLLALVGVGVSFLPIFRQGREVFMVRWDTAAVGAQGDAWGSLLGRVLAGFTQPLRVAAETPFFGHGIGVGSNVAARLLAGHTGFLLAEDEWSKDFLELGPLLGAAFIGFRLAVTVWLGAKALAALVGRRDNLPALIFSACAVPLLLDQWAPPTILGFAVLGGGLLLAALNEEPEEDEATTDGTEDADGEQEQPAIVDPGVRY